MNLKERFRIAAILGIINAVILGLVLIYAAYYFLIPFISLFFLIGFFSLSLKCPRCKKPVLRDRLTVFGLEFYIWTFWIPRKCAKCGNPLN